MKAGLFMLVCWALLIFRLMAGASESAGSAWENTYSNRVQWWSLQPVRAHAIPIPQDPSWARNFIDRFVQVRLDEKQLNPAREADPATLARRLSFAVTGLPLAQATWQQFVKDTSPQAFDRMVQTLLGSPHFGERWARHWMDVVHYSDTHGYEWDAPAKDAWRFRDYLIRAYNADVPMKRLVLEQIAGDLVEPRLDSTGTINESMIGPMALRLGERRHGDNAAAEGVSQEAIANIIDTVGKGFLATTIACAQCHDHKLDAVAQRDFYSMAGVFMSTRWSVRCVDVVDKNERIIRELKTTKDLIRQELTRIWMGARPSLLAAIRSTKPNNSASNSVPSSLGSFYERCAVKPVSIEEFNLERTRRVQVNEQHLKLAADFGQGSPEAQGGWRWEGLGMKHGLVKDGELVIREDGSKVLRHLLPRGRWSHSFSTRLAGALRSPLFDPQSVTTVSIQMASGNYAAKAMIVDQAFHSERMEFLDVPIPTWKTFTAGNYDTLEGSIDQVPRRSYLELVTKSLNNYFPPRTGYGGVKESETLDPRSWVGASKVYQHPPGKGPQDELDRFLPLFKSTNDLPARFTDLVLAAVTRWSRNDCQSQDVTLINESLQLHWLTNDITASPALTQLVESYRALEKQIQPDQTVGSAEEWNEARNERIGIRGSYTELGSEAPRGCPRFLQGIPMAGELKARHFFDNRLANQQSSLEDLVSRSSGRLELAHALASDSNPLTARVFVNRVWYQLFGEGLVRTPDDFGHLGETPSHPELLDTLTLWFIENEWSLKRLVTLIVTSSTWRQSAQCSDTARGIDPENRLWHHLPSRRLDAEAIRDSLLAVSGRLDSVLYGAPFDPHRSAQDPAKRLFCGPLDGNGRRSVYTKITLMEPPRFLALFNQPIPKVTSGRRDVTQVPDQALALLNDPFVHLMAKEWSNRLVREPSGTPTQRARYMIEQALGRTAEPSEVERLVGLAQQSALLQSIHVSNIMSSQVVWQDVAHALLNLNELIHVH
jgi:hypothetical protein